MSDQIDEAIENTNGEPEVEYLTNRVQLPTGEIMAVQVPRRRFTSDEFETAVGMLIQLRYTVMELDKQENPPTILPVMKPGLVGPDGKKLS